MFTELPLTDNNFTRKYLTHEKRTRIPVRGYMRTDYMRMWRHSPCMTSSHAITWHSLSTSATAVKYKLHDSRLVRVWFLYFTYTQCMASHWIY